MVVKQSFPVIGNFIGEGNFHELRSTQARLELSQVTPAHLQKSIRSRVAETAIVRRVKSAERLAKMSGISEGFKT